ncbi:hypothetical protein SteCoe_850 [Stentor coeruleus]|uniref:Uncharacterized protein n=1 Tax=Stentor coeruleus TaxID=5963 RepID=A0A1R2D3H0_9CILI|nr:hypothetical protein SteCoe_850 [Stentor coeruleus]
MADKERKSFLVPPTEVKNYDIQDIYDLEDCLEVLESIVEELQQPSRKKGEISTFMAKYIYMEDSILEGLEKLPKLACTREMQQRLLDATKKFNKLSYEYQETWNNEFWAIYDGTRNPKKAQNEFHQVKSHQQISKQLLDLQEIAITLTRMSRGTTGDYSSPINKEPFAMVDEEALKYKEPTVKETNEGRECGKCFVF